MLISGTPAGDAACTCVNSPATVIRTAINAVITAMPVIFLLAILIILSRFLYVSDTLMLILYHNTKQITLALYR